MQLVANIQISHKCSNNNTNIQLVTNIRDVKIMHAIEKKLD